MNRNTLEERLAILISYLAHPLLMPMVGLLVITHSETYAADLDPRFANFIYLTLLLLTFLLPSTLTTLFYYLGVSKTIQFGERQERILPLYITLFFYIMAYLLIRRLPISHIYQRFMFSASISLVLVTVITHFWKISTHLVGWGGIVGLIGIISYRFNSDLMILLIIAILITGITGYARLRLNEHRPMQICAGFLLGLLVMLIVFYV